MQKFVTKGLRTYRPYILKLELRPELWAWLEDFSEDLHCHPSVLARGLLEDAFDCFGGPDDGCVRLVIRIPKEEQDLLYHYVMNGGGEIPDHLHPHALRELLTRNGFIREAAE